MQRWKSSLLKPFLLAAFCGGTEADDSGEQSGQTHLTLGYCWLSNFTDSPIAPAFMCLVLQLHWTLSPVCQSCMYLDSLPSVWCYSSRRKKKGWFFWGRSEMESSKRYPFHLICIPLADTTELRYLYLSSAQIILQTLSLPSFQLGVEVLW